MAANISGPAVISNFQNCSHYAPANIS